MQPLLASGRYGDFKELALPRTFDSIHTARRLLSRTIPPGARTPSIPDASGPSPSFSFNNPDFNFKSLRLNAIFRWEFRPGSTLYVVWTEQRQDDSNPGEFRVRRDFSRLFSARFRRCVSREDDVLDRDDDCSYFLNRGAPRGEGRFYSFGRNPFRSRTLGLTAR